MDEDQERCEGSRLAESQLEREGKCWAFDVSARMRAKKRHCTGGLPRDQKISRGFGKATATPTQTKGKHPVSGDWNFQ